MKNEDTMIRAFMQDHKKEVDDIYFSRKVMQKLPPVHRSKEWIVIPFAALGTLLAWLLGADTPIQVKTLQMPDDFNIYYLIGVVAAIPFVVLTLYYLKEKKVQLL
jgi:hypothetical protein